MIAETGSILFLTDGALCQMPYGDKLDCYSRFFADVNDS
jgi:hypothetical protein